MMRLVGQNTCEYKAPGEYWKTRARCKWTERSGEWAHAATHLCSHYIPAHISLTSHNCKDNRPPPLKCCVCFACFAQRCLVHEFWMTKMLMTTANWLPTAITIAICDANSCWVAFVPFGFALLRSWHRLLRTNAMKAKRCCVKHARVRATHKRQMSIIA